jgi:diacylglycerol kinase family enzyme
VPRLVPTTADDPGEGQAREAVAAGAGLVLVAGGDGTVRAAAQGLAGSGVPLGILPQGTGNLLARNLEIPHDDADAALDVALTGADRTLDLGRLDDGTMFAVMAGTGFDARMMREAPEGLKGVLGWPAYIVGGARGLRRSRVHVQVALDDEPPRAAVVRSVLVGNVGQLQGGLELLPDAAPDDGVLDIALVAPRNPKDWVVLIGRALTRRHRPDRRLELLRAGRSASSPGAANHGRSTATSSTTAAASPSSSSPARSSSASPAPAPRRRSRHEHRHARPGDQRVQPGGALRRRRPCHGAAGRCQAAARRHVAADALRRRLQLEPRDRVPVRPRAWCRC